ncbi:MAG: MG2 domain-containing protein [Treponema sp.]|nr:MG2 domain-containing protein [Treponema sp.]
MKKHSYIFLSILILLQFFSSCSSEYNPPDPTFISGVSGGILARNEQIRVEFVHGRDMNTPLPGNVFSFSPALAGTASWQNEHTLIFTPNEPLRAGRQYKVRVRLPGITSFGFDFMTALPVFEVELNPVRVNNLDEVFITGTIKVDDVASLENIQRAISSGELGRPEIYGAGNVYSFAFNPVLRGETSRTAEVTWNGRSLGSSERGYTSVIIPGRDNFEMLSVHHNAGIIEVAFSSPLREYQDLRGFASLSGRTDVRFSIEDNIVRIFGDDHGDIPIGSELLIRDLTDINGNHLTVPVQYRVGEVWELPEVRFTGSGVILPTGQGSQLVVETRNIAGLLVEAFRIHDHNMIQFLQVNNLDGDRELDRVGEPAWSRSFDFEWEERDQNRWIRRGLDLSELSRNYPDSMFHLRISFRQRHIRYECSESHRDFSHLLFPDDSFPAFYTATGNSFWDNVWSSPGFDWNEWWTYRNDPCHPSFYHNHYNGNIIRSRNILISDLGLLARRGLDGSWLIATTNLLNALPSPNTRFSFYNFQGRLLYQGRTDNEGMAFIPEPIPGTGPTSRLFLIAENSTGKAYLRVNDSSTLAISHFDVSGSTPASDIRGLIYGERGVWRPGDDVYLTFLLSDPRGSLPQNHPVNFEFEDPRGRIVISQNYTSSIDGFYPIQISTAANAPTGEWTARIRVGGNVFSRPVRIETVMPNRLMINMDIDGVDFIRSGTQGVALNAEWLFGAPAPGLKADISVSFSDRQTVFPQFPDFSFRDPSRRVSSERHNVWEGNLDDTGNAVFQMSLNPGVSVPGKVNAGFMTRVFESSGAFSSSQFSVEYSPYSRYVGLRLPAGDAERGMLLTDTDHTAEIVLLDEEGNLVRESVTLSAELYELNWRWWWERGREDSAEIASSISRRPIARGTVTTVNGRASWDFRVNHPDWGRYLVIIRDGNTGHAAAQIVYIDWPGWAGRGQDGGQGVGAMLNLSSDKPAYNVGERVTVSFPSNIDARANIVVEKGGEIIEHRWMSCEDGITHFEFIANPSMVPNVYVHVSLLQPHLQTQNDLPLRLYGIIPITINDPRVVLSPKITAPENWQAESSVSFTVSEESGRPMAYTVAVVDEGLLGLTRFNLPNPINTFYAREASFLNSWDLFHEVIGAYSGRLETLLAIGGGEDIIMDSDNEARRFIPIVRFFGPFEIGSGEQKTETFELPPYIGALRIMVLAASSLNEVQNISQRAYGTAEESVRVTSDLMVFATLPRVLSPNDEVVVPVHVNSYIEGSRNVRVSLSVEGAEIIGQTSQVLSFNGSGEQLIRFTVKAPPNPGLLRFRTIAESERLTTARHEVELQVRSTAIPVTRTMYSLLSQGESWNGNIEMPGREGSNTVTVEFSRMPPLNLENRLGFLINYPHGCVEQVASSIFPQLYLERIIRPDENRLQEIRSNVNAGITHLLGMQLMSGGFSYWPGEAAANDWASSYVGHLLLEARRLGYNVPDNVIRSWVQYQRNNAALWTAQSGRFNEQAYRLFTLSLAGEADLGSMNRLRSHANLPPQAGWRLAASYWHAGQRDVARNMIRGLSIPEHEYRELSGTFGSTLRDKAMILETLILINSGPNISTEELGRTRVLFAEICEVLSSERWLSTQETAFALIAISPYIEANAGTGIMTVDYNTGGLAGTASFESPALILDAGYVQGNMTQFNFTNRSPSPVYVKLIARGLPIEGSEPVLSEGLELFVEYRNSNGIVINPDSLALGEDMEIRVRIRNSFISTVEEIALIVPVPASYEIINTRLAESTSIAENFRYRDIRDDRVMTYFNLNRGEERVFSFMVNKSYDGIFYRPAIHAYAMYDESIRALIPGSR